MHWRFTWSSAKTLQPLTRSVTEVILMSRFVDINFVFKTKSWKYLGCLAGLSSSRQNQKRKAQNQSEEAHAEPCIWRGPAVLHVIEQPRVENALADRLAQRYVRKKRLFGRSDAQLERQNLWQSPATMVPPRRKGECIEDYLLKYTSISAFSERTFRRPFNLPWRYYRRIEIHPRHRLIRILELSRP